MILFKLKVGPFKQKRTYNLKFVFFLYTLLYLASTVQIMTKEHKMITFLV